MDLNFWMIWLYPVVKEPCQSLVRLFSVCVVGYTGSSPKAAEGSLWPWIFFFRFVLTNVCLKQSCDFPHRSWFKISARFSSDLNFLLRSREHRKQKGSDLLIWRTCWFQYPRLCKLQVFLLCNAGGKKQVSLAEGIKGVGCGRRTLWLRPKPEAAMVFLWKADEIHNGP